MWGPRQLLARGMDHFTHTQRLPPLLTLRQRNITATSAAVCMTLCISVLPPVGLLLLLHHFTGADDVPGHTVWSHELDCEAGDNTLEALNVQHRLKSSLSQI